MGRDEAARQDDPSYGSYRSRFGAERTEVVEERVTFREIIIRAQATAETAIRQRAAITPQYETETVMEWGIDRIDTATAAGVSPAYRARGTTHLHRRTSDDGHSNTRIWHRIEV